MARVLLVDDDEDFLAALRAVLEIVGQHEVTLAADGEVALSTLGSEAEFDIVVSDVLMPRLGGFELLSLMRRRGIEVPVIFTSSLGSDGDTRLDGLRLGAVDFVAKPCLPEEIEMRIDRHLARAQARRASEPGREPDPPTLDPDLLEEGGGVELPAWLAAATDLRAELLGGPEDPRVLPRPDLAGRLERLGLPALFALIEGEIKSGVLLLVCPADIAWIAIRRGRPVGASIASEPDNGWEVAIFEALTWAEGAFEFLEMPVAIERASGPAVGVPADARFMHLLLEHARIQDEAGE